MKIKLRAILLLITMLISAGVAVSHAQGEGMLDVEMLDSDKGSFDRERIIYSAGEADIPYRSKSIGSPVKDTVSTNTNQASTPPTTPATSVTPPKTKAEKPAPATKPTVEKQSKDEDESILSFNFLYYIIQKYKLQDIVD